MASPICDAVFAGNTSGTTKPKTLTPERLVRLTCNTPDLISVLMTGPSGLTIASFAVSVVFGGAATIVALRADWRSRKNEKRQDDRDARAAADQQRARLIASIVHEDRQHTDARRNLNVSHRVYLRLDNWGPSPASDIQFVPGENYERMTSGPYAVPVLHPGQADRCPLSLFVNDPGILEGQLSWNDGAGPNAIQIYLTVV